MSGTENACKGLIAFDLDGTVLTSRVACDMTERVSSAFAAAHEAGYQISISTGRPMTILTDTLLKKPWLDWCLSSNGAAVTNVRTGETYFDKTYSYELMCEVMDCIEGLDTGYWADVDKVLLCEKRDLKDFPYATKRKGAVLTDSVRNDPHVKNGVRKLIIHFADRATRDEAHERLAIFDGRLEYPTEGEKAIEVTASGCTKANAALRICDILGVRYEDSVSFGDAGNDLSYAGVPMKFVVMDSAEDFVKAQADDICPDVHHDGVAVWIENHLL